MGRGCLGADSADGEDRRSREIARNTQIVREISLLVPSHDADMMPLCTMRLLLDCFRRWLAFRTPVEEHTASFSTMTQMSLARSTRATLWHGGLDMYLRHGELCLWTVKSRKNEKRCCLRLKLWRIVKRQIVTHIMMQGAAESSVAGARSKAESDSIYGNDASLQSQCASDSPPFSEGSNLLPFQPLPTAS